MLYLRELSPKRRRPNITGSAWSWPRARGDLAEIYSTSARYYQYMEEYERAVAYIDSAVTVYKRNGTKSGFRLHIRSAVVALRASGRLQKRPRRCANPIRSATTTGVEEAQNSLAEMQTLFEVGQLELEKIPAGQPHEIHRPACRRGCCCCSSAGASTNTSWSGRLEQIRRQLTDANQEITRQSRRATESER